MLDSKNAWVVEELAALQRQGLRRSRKIRASAQGVEIEIDGKRLINFGSNDYLGLASDPRITGAARQAMQKFGWGSGASPLLSGYSDPHHALQKRLAEFEGTEAALLFSSGYAANLGAICAFVGRGDAIFSDENNHASIVDGCRLSRADVFVYPHTCISGLRQLLDDNIRFRRRLIVTDTLFSMDGDLAPLSDLADLAEERECMILVDEAHATGVFGESGRGIAEQEGVEDRIDIRVGTLSKALGAAGGFVAASESMIELLSNRARSYVFSTAHPAAGCAAAITALQIVGDDETHRKRLLENAALLRTKLRQMGLNTGNSGSQIIPIILGDNEKVMQWSKRLLERGLFVPGIRPPTVAPGHALLRISLSTGHSEEMIEQLSTALADLAAEEN